MRDKTDIEYCSIIDTVCPYDHGCSVCRLHNDYEDAVEKARRMTEKQGGSKE